MVWFRMGWIMWRMDGARLDETGCLVEEFGDFN